MGTTTNKDRSASPQVAVTISRGFWMGKYPMTPRDYLNLIGDNPSTSTTNHGYSHDLDRPVETVSWIDATNFCAKLTTRDLAAGRIPEDCAYCLPTEAEWEYACRAWTSTQFYYGDDPTYTNLTNYAWYIDSSQGMTHPVGQKLPNLWGLFDMHGNVYEWCQDWWLFGYRGSIAVDPTGPDKGSNRVLRGGYFDAFAFYCQSASRLGFGPSLKEPYTGFRIVLATIQP